MKIFDVRNYGAVADGVTLCQAAVQKAVDDCHAQGGGIVRFDGGMYALSTIFLKSNVRIQVTKDTKILGSLNFYDYAPHEKIDYPLYQDASHSYFDTSLFVAKDCENIAIFGDGEVDMRSVWDTENTRNMAHRGAKCIALKNCKNVEVSGLGIYNATDLAVYFAGCENVDVYGLKLRVYIDGISPDNSANVRIHDCEIETGDDGIVFKTSYTLNRLGVCRDVRVWNCKIKSRCSAVKFGTETNGGFENILIENIEIFDTRITGIAIESVDGAVVDGITIRNVNMRNVGAALFTHLGLRMRGPAGREKGEIRNVTLENITAVGPYKPYEIIAWNYDTYKAGDTLQLPWKAAFAYTNMNLTEDDPWQLTCNICGLKERPLKNITLRNVHLELVGGVQTFNPTVRELPREYPEVDAYGGVLPAAGIFFRYVDGLTLENVTVKTLKPDARENFVFENVTGLQVQ